MKTKLLMIIKIYYVICEIDIKNKLYKDVELIQSGDIMGECSTKIAAKFFSPDQDIKVIYHENFDGKINFLKALVSEFTISLANNICKCKARENVILMSNDLAYLRELFCSASTHVYSHYLVFTHIPLEDLIDFSVSLRKRKYAYIAFLMISSKRRALNLYQLKIDCCDRKNKDVNLNLTELCSFDTKVSGLIPVKEIFCPAFICELRFIRVDYGATKEELYDISKNGTLMSADSYGACVLKAFARFHKITIAREEYVSNYNWYNTVQSLRNGEIDIAFGPTLPPNKLVEDLEKVVPYTFEEFIFIDAVPKVHPPMYVLITPLGVEVWICFGLVALLYFIYVVSLKNLNTNNIIYEKINCLHLIAIFFNQVIRLPKKIGVRIVISLWLIYAFFINAIYNCNFISSMIKIEHSNMLQNFQELQISTRKFGGPDVAKEWLFNIEDPTMMNLYNRYEVIHPDNISRALYELGMIVAQTDYVITKTRMTNFYALKEKIVSYPLLYYMPKGHPYAPHIARFMEKIRQNNVPLFKCLVKAEKFDIEEFNAITMIHLQIIFKFLALNHLMSIIVFFIEYFY